MQAGKVSHFTGAIGVIALAWKREPLSGAAKIVDAVKEIYPQAEVPFSILPPDDFALHKQLEGLGHPVMGHGTRTFPHPNFINGSFNSLSPC